MTGVRQIWPEMPAPIATEADRRLLNLDLFGALRVIQRWEMTIRRDQTLRYLDAINERDLARAQRDELRATHQ